MKKRTGIYLELDEDMAIDVTVATNGKFFGKLVTIDEFVQWASDSGYREVTANMGKSGRVYLKAYSKSGRWVFIEGELLTRINARLADPQPTKELRGWEV